MNLLVINGSPKGEKANTQKLLHIAAAAAQQAGAALSTLTLADSPLPLFSPQTDPTAPVKEVQQLLIQADAFLIGCPEYHGSMTGTLKNFFDHYYEEFAGKLVGIVASTGGSQGQSVLSHIRDTCLYLHAWTLPYNVSAKLSDFENSELANPKTRDRLEKLGHDLAVYGQLLSARFQKDLGTKGFAEWHSKHTKT